MRNPRDSSTKLQRGHRVGSYIQEALKYCLQDWVCPSQFRGFVCFFLHKTIKRKSSSVGPAPESSAPRLAPFSRRSQGSAVEFPFCGSSHRMSNPLMSFQSHWPHQQATLWPLLELNHLGPAKFAVNSRTQAEHVILPRLADVENDVTQLFCVVHSRACACSAPTSPNVSSDPRPPQRARLHGHISCCQLLPVTRPHLRPSGAPTMGGRFAAWLRRSAHIQAHRRSTTLLLRSGA